MEKVIRKHVIKRAKRSIIWKIPLEEFKKIVKKSSTISQILRNFNFENKGNNYKTVKARCNEENIDLSHIKLGMNSNLGRKFNVTKTPIEDILVEDSNYNRYNLKRRLVEEGILEYKCVKCGCDGNWLGEKLVLQLEHKNGKSKDNRIENICFLCPNCHSQTLTYCGRNISKNKIKIKKERPLKFQITKEALEKLILNTPLTKIGKMFNVTDNAIKKRCKKLNINITKSPFKHKTGP
jgi:uncharacterized protein YktA (UPF0223 family)